MEASQPRRYASELTLCDGVNDYHVFHPSVVPGPDDTPYTFQDANEIEILLDRHMNHSVKAEFLLKNFLTKEDIPVQNIYSRRDRIQSLTRYIMERPVIVTPHVPPEKRGGNNGGSAESKPQEGFLAGYPHKDKQRIDFLFIDAETGKPVPGVRARIIHDDGTHQDLVSSKHGTISRDYLTPGTCTLFSDPTKILNLTVNKTVTPNTTGKASHSLFGKEDTPASPGRSYLCNVLEHPVADGDTLTSIAEANGLSFEDLARFNWGTGDRKKAVSAMKRDVGCAKETESGDDCLFESSNKPGIVFIPQPFEQNGFATGAEHTVKISKTGFGAFAEPFEVTIVDDEGDPLPDLTCELTHPNGVTETVKTDKNGVISFTQTNASKTKIRIPGIDSSDLTKV